MKISWLLVLKYRNSEQDSLLKPTDTKLIQANAKPKRIQLQGKQNVHKERETQLIAKSQGKRGTWSSPCSPRPTRRGGSFGVDATPHEAVLVRLQSWGPSAKGPAQSPMLSLSCQEKERPGSKRQHCWHGPKCAPLVSARQCPSNTGHTDEVLPGSVPSDLCRLSRYWNVSLLHCNAARLLLQTLT